MEDKNSNKSLFRQLFYKLVGHRDWELKIQINHLKVIIRYHQIVSQVAGFKIFSREYPWSFLESGTKTLFKKILTDTKCIKPEDASTATNGHLNFKEKWLFCRMLKLSDYWQSS